jgi:hypothetical protein
MLFRSVENPQVAEYMPNFIAGLMYLVQSYRLKKHFSPQTGLKLPSLEWLQSVNKQSLVYSSCFIALGLVAGIVLNTIKFQGQGKAVPWTDGVILSSAGLLTWLLAATIFEWTYKPAQQGRKVAYLTVASFVFLARVMAILLAGGSEHAQPRAEASFRFQVCGFKFATWNVKPETWNLPDPHSEDRA